MNTLTDSRATIPARAPSPGANLFNRELSWLQFNSRVLQVAMDPNTPLLEQVRYLGIFSSNLDEFFMKRVGGLKRQVLAGVTGRSPDGMTARQQLDSIRPAVQDLLAQQAQHFDVHLRPQLAAAGIHLISWQELTDAERHEAMHYFDKNVFPILTPFAVDPGHPFPFLSNLSLSLGVALAQPGQSTRLFARVKVPSDLPQWLLLQESQSSSEMRFLNLLDLITAQITRLFPGMQVMSVTPFRVTRNADVEADGEDAEDLLELIEKELQQRRFARVIRLEHCPGADPWIIAFLRQHLQLKESDTYEVPGLIDYEGLAPVADLDVADLKFQPWVPTTPPALVDETADIFSVIRSGDLLVHHPYECFRQSVERFLLSAADDERVRAIKVTVYRVGDNARILDILIRAAEAGKQVVCLVELQARFDEQRNIAWAQHLERAGVHVVYGVVGLKTHSKLALVARQEEDGVRCYAHIGTGNYNAQTATIYTDLGLFTCNESITREALTLFNYLTGRSMDADCSTLLVAPMNMREVFLERIETEIAHRRSGRPARIIAKMNALGDSRIMEALYRAADEGVEIDLLVRGFCCLRPPRNGRIRVVSIVGRFLEHSRLFYFRNGAEQASQGLIYMGSADWLFRNLNHRVELITPIHDESCRQRIWSILQHMLEDRRDAWQLQSNGDYCKRTPLEGSAAGSQSLLMLEALQQAAPGSEKPGGEVVSGVDSGVNP